MAPKYDSSFLDRVAQMYAKTYSMLSKDEHAGLLREALGTDRPFTSLPQYNCWLRETMPTLQPHHIEWIKTDPLDVVIHEFYLVPEDACASISGKSGKVDPLAGLDDLMKRTEEMLPFLRHRMK